MLCNGVLGELHGEIKRLALGKALFSLPNPLPHLKQGAHSTDLLRGSLQGLLSVILMCKAWGSKKGLYKGLDLLKTLYATAVSYVFYCEGSWELKRVNYTQY